VKSIEIDLDVHREIELARTSFDESENQILRRVLKLDKPMSPIPTGKSRRKGLSRRTGTYRISVHQDEIVESSLKDAYKSALRMLAESDPGFLERLAEHKTSARRIVARTPADLYLKTPDLAAQFAERLVDDYWLDTNLSQQQIISRLRTAARVAKCQFGRDVAISFPA